MNPSNHSSRETPGLNLPPPMAEQAPVPMPGSAESQPEAPIQSAPSAPERAPSSAAAGVTAALPAMPAPSTDDTTNPLLPTQQTGVDTTSQSAKKKLIKDEDLIEKEWVEKAKKIVDQTKNDPHQQSEQLTLVKADYMKRRYDKNIKVNK